MPMAASLPGRRSIRGCLTAPPGRSITGSTSAMTWTPRSGTHLPGVRSLSSLSNRPGISDNKERYTDGSLREKAMVVVKKSRQPVNKTEEVNEFMEKVDHPFKAEVQAVRDIIKNVNS